MSTNQKRRDSNSKVSEFSLEHKETPFFNGNGSINPTRKGSIMGKNDIMPSIKNNNHTLLDELLLDA